MLSPTLFLLFLVSFIAFAKAADLYKILDLDRSASERDIRKAYKSLSKRYHPDKNKDPGAEDRFVDIAHAYEVLSDPKKREIYDHHGEDGLKAHEGGQPYGNPFDIFSSFFGGGHPGHQQVRRGPTSVSEIEVSLADMYNGHSIDFTIRKRILCDHCRGTGAFSSNDIHSCSNCQGSGMVVTRQQVFPGMFAQSQSTCPVCGGRGRTIARVCPGCHGQKVLEESVRYTLEVEKGVPEGWEAVFEGEGDESPDWEPGDVVLRVRSKKETGGWHRKENNLYWKETIGIDEALLGLRHNLTHLDGHIIELIRNGVTQPGFVQTIKGQGMSVFRKHNQYGDLFVEYNVVLPLELDNDMRKKLSLAFYGSDRPKDEL